MGVVYYANYFVWFEVGRTDLLRSLGGSYRELEGDGVLLPVIAAHCEYAHPARYDDELEVRTTSTLVSAARIVFDYEIVRLADGKRLATGRTEHAAIAPGGRPCRLPERFRDLLT